jgi:hypothetical protein
MKSVNSINALTEFLPFFLLAKPDNPTLFPIEKVENRVMEIFGVEKDTIYSNERRKIQVAARSLLRNWAVRGLGLTATVLAKRLDVTQPAVSYAVSRGERIARERNYSLVL